MSEPISPAEVSKPPVRERIGAVLGTLRRNPQLVTYPTAVIVGGALGGAVMASAEAVHPVEATVIGAVFGAVVGLLSHAKVDEMRGDLAVERGGGNEASDPGPIATGKVGGYKDLVTAWKTGKPVEPGVDYYHKGNERPGGNSYSTDSHTIDE